MAGWTVTAKELQKLIGHVAFAASTEESRPILNGVLWELRPDRMRMVATNGHRLARMDVPLAGWQAPGRPDRPAQGAGADPPALRRRRRRSRSARSDNHLGFRSATTQVYTRLIEGPYPNYEQVIPRENDKVATADKAALTAALRRMSTVASDQTHRIRMAFASGSCKLSVQTPDLGEAQDEMTVTYEGEPLEIGFNATYLLEILKFMPDRRSAADLQGAGTGRDLRAGGLGRSGQLHDAGDAAAAGGLTGGAEGRQGGRQQKGQPASGCPLRFPCRPRSVARRPCSQPPLPRLQAIRHHHLLDHRRR